MMRQLRTGSVAVSAVLAASAPFVFTVTSSAASSTPSAQAVRAAHDATTAARNVTFRVGNGSGTVSLQRIGRTRTRVRVLIPQGGNYRFRLYPGSDCNSNRGMAASAIALTPMNTAGTNAAPSETIVNLPIEKVTRQYVVDVQNATTSAQVANACARLTP